MYWKTLITTLLCESALAQDLMTVLKEKGFNQFSNQLEGDPILTSLGSNVLVYAPTDSGLAKTNSSSLNRRDEEDDALVAKNGARVVNRSAPIPALPPDVDDAASRRFVRAVETGGSAWVTLLDDPKYVNLPDGRNQSILEKPSASGGRPFVFSGLGASVQVASDDIPFNNGIIRPIDG